MPTFESYDGTLIAYRVTGQGPELVCLPGGPGRAGVYLGDLGGLSDHRTLIIPDTRGSGESADATDEESYRCDRLVADVEALREHLGLEQFDLFGHSAAGALATLYAAAHPERLSHLILMTPMLNAVGVEPAETEWRAALAARSGEPWFAEAMAAVEKAEAGDESTEVRRGYQPFGYGRWDEAASAHSELGLSDRAKPVLEHYGSAGVFEPGRTRKELQRLTAPVLVYAGGLDTAPTPPVAAEGASCFPDATTVVQPGGGHFPWLDDPVFFIGAITRFLAAAS